MATEVYDISDFVGLSTPGIIYIPGLSEDVANSSITSQLLGISREQDTDPITGVVNSDDVIFIFATALTAPEVTALDAIVASHTGDLPADPPEDNTTSGSGPPSGDTGLSLGDIIIDDSVSPREAYVLTDDTQGAEIYAKITNEDHGSLSGLGDNDHPQYQLTSEKGTANGYCELDAGGKVPASRIPSVALPEVHVVADAAARTALTVQEGDEAIQLDDGSHWIYDGSAWQARPSASGDVSGGTVSVDLEFALYSGTTGKVLTRIPGLKADSSGNIQTPGTVDGRDIAADGIALDAHIANTGNPHSTSIANIGSGTLGQLNSKITDGNLDFSGTSRPPLNHATSHQAGQSDELGVTSLGVGTLGDGKVLARSGASLTGIDPGVAVKDGATLVDGVSTELRFGTNLSVTSVSSGIVQIDGPSIPAIPVRLFASNTSTVNTSNTNYVTYLTLANIPDGSYDIDWHYVWSYKDTGSDFEAKVVTDDGTVLLTHVQEPKEKDEGQRFSVAGFNVHTFSGGTSNNSVLIKFRSTKNNKKAYMYSAFLRLRSY